MLPRAALAPERRARAAGRARHRAAPGAAGRCPRRPCGARPAPQRLSYSSLQAYARCPYRFYLERVLGLPDGAAAAAAAGAPAEAREAGARPAAARLARPLAARALDFARPDPPAAERSPRWPRSGVELTAAEVEDMRALVARSRARRCAGGSPRPRAVRREAPFAFALEPAGGGSLVIGVVDVLADRGGRRRPRRRLQDRPPRGRRARRGVDRDYATQRAVYALAALRGGAQRVEVAHCFLERPGEPVVAASAPPTRPRWPSGARARPRRARGALPGHRAPHRELCGDCPGRRALCS